MTDGHFMMIPLTQDKFAIVDEEDYPLVSDFKWHVAKRHRLWYAARYIGPQKIQLMHVMITGRKGMDHINDNGLDNRRINLQEATHAQNIRKQRIRADNKSGFKGVSWDKVNNKWRATCKQQSLGRFADPADAARAYDRAAVKVFGAFARLNFPNDIGLLCQVGKACRSSRMMGRTGRSGSLPGCWKFLRVN